MNKQRITSAVVLFVLIVCIPVNPQVGRFSGAITEFRAEGQSRLDTLLALAKAQHIPLGVEFVDDRLLKEPVRGDFSGKTVNQVLGIILPASEGYVWREDHGTLFITNSAMLELRANPFDLVMHRFELRKPATLQEASNLLYMDAEIQIHPEVTGFAGTLNHGSQVQAISPIDLVDVTIRSCLDILVGKHGDAAWVAGAPPKLIGNTPTARLWRIIEYQDLPTSYSEELVHSLLFSGRNNH